MSTRLALLLLGATLLSASSIAAETAVTDVAAAASARELRSTLHWDLRLDAEGHVTALEFTGAAIDALRTQLEAAIKRWEFEPGKINGKPAATETALAVQVGLIESADGKDYSVLIRDVRTGGKVGKVKKSSLMKPLPMRRGAVIPLMRVAIEVHYDADGKATSADVAAGSGKAPQPLISATKDMIRQWTFAPEKVGGIGVAGSLVIPVCFTQAKTAKETQKLLAECRWELPGSDVKVGNGQSVALDSAVRLKTDISKGVL